MIFWIYDAQLSIIISGQSITIALTRLCLQEVFHVYLNKFENVVTHLFLVIFELVIIDFNGLVRSPGIRSHQENSF